MFHCNNIVHAFQSVHATTTIPNIPLASQVAAAAALISTASRLLSSLSKVTRSPNACEYQDTQVIVIQLHFQSALNAGSNCTDAFSSNTAAPDIVLLLNVCVAEVVTILTPSIATTQALTLLNVVSEACHSSIDVTQESPQVIVKLHCEVNA
jgi:hypothetical protein